MKLRQLKTSLFIIISAISFTAFVFLNTVQSNPVALQQFGMHSSALEKEDLDQQDQVKKFGSGYFPEISAVKRVYELMRKFIPAS
ncbi:MAG: hypothetical protein ACOYOA_04830 [Saprospiraceae bacterium]|jgi:hypothetical protein